MTVLRRLDAVQEPTKPAVLGLKATLDRQGIVNQDAALRSVSGRPFYNASKFRLRDLKSRGPCPEDPQTAASVRFIEVKGRAGVGEVPLGANEYKTAQRLGQDYRLYVGFNCGGRPEVHQVQDPARLH